MGSYRLIRIYFVKYGDDGFVNCAQILQGSVHRVNLIFKIRVRYIHYMNQNIGLAHLVQGEVTRFDVPGIHALNFLCRQALDGGGMASLRNDPLGKGMAQILLCMPVRVPPDVAGAAK